ncbi:phage major capsid protein [Candidatus Halocynthiibacter alkanivorans]|uniref:phage major capsid protein n=1 Tax=Candidatus Halocynthiibacter alkanivorans TaxID=2267619 RepID=UPI000DF1B352|nr:phage major capsid protein [Candidatus Halocynthiibacter alkanivorans]
MSVLIKELKEKRARIITNARAKFDEIKDDTPAARAKELETEFDAAMTEADAIEARIGRLEKLEQAEQRLNAGDPRRPLGEDGEGRGVQDPAPMNYRAAFHANLAAIAAGDACPANVRAVLAAGYSTMEAAGEARAQIAGVQAAGGYLVPDEMHQELIKVLAAWGPMYDDNICTVLPTTGGGTMPLPSVDDTGEEAVQNTAEGDPIADTGTKDVVFTKTDLSDYLYDTEWLKISIQLQTGSYIGVEALINSLLAERLGRKLNRDLTTGDGAGKPLGINAGSALGYTAVSASAITSDEILTLVHSVDAAYRASPKARAMFNDSTLLALHKMKDGQGNYLIQEAPDGLGRLKVGAVTVPYSVNQAMPSIAAAVSPIVYGDFSRYFVRKIGGISIMSIQDSKFAPGIGVMGFARMGGTVGDAKAIKRLKMAAA